MKSCPELIITPCKTCNAHVMSYLAYDERGHAVITCPVCSSTLFDKPFDEESERFIKNQRSYYQMAIDIMPEFAALSAPGDKVNVEDIDNTLD